MTTIRGMLLEITELQNTPYGYSDWVALDRARELAGNALAALHREGEPNQATQPVSTPAAWVSKETLDWLAARRHIEGTTVYTRLRNEPINEESVPVYTDPQCAGLDAAHRAAEKAEPVAMCGFIPVRESAVNWLKDKYPALCEKAGLYEFVRAIEAIHDIGPKE